MAYGSYGSTEAKCRSCGARIIFIKTKKGHMMPCNPTVTRYAKTEGGKEKVVLDNGEVVSCTTNISADEAEGVGYISHFATCPYANMHKKGKGKTRR